MIFVIKSALARFHSSRLPIGDKESAADQHSRKKAKRDEERDFLLRLPLPTTE